jgi:alkylhydroperoxidase family enzyme
MSKTLTATARDAAHIRTQDGRACPCCADWTRPGVTARVRRVQRHRERAAWQAEAADAIAARRSGLDAL